MSKFVTGEVAISWESFLRDWPSWTEEEQGELTSAFYSEDIELSRKVFHFFISQATLDSRYRYSDVFAINQDKEEAFTILSTWIADPKTPHRQALLLGLLSVAVGTIKERAVELIQNLLDQLTANGEFWQTVEDGSVSHEQADLVTTYLAFLGWMGQREKVIPILRRIANANLQWVSDHAASLVAYGKDGQWSL